MLAHRIRYHCNYAMGKYKVCVCVRACVCVCVSVYGADEAEGGGGEGGVNDICLKTKCL